MGEIRPDFKDRFLTAFALSGTVFSVLFVAVIRPIAHHFRFFTAGSDLFWYSASITGILAAIFMVALPVETALEVKGWGMGKSLVSWAVIIVVLGGGSHLLVFQSGWLRGEAFGYAGSLSLLTAILAITAFASIPALPVVLISKLLYKRVEKFKTLIYLVSGVYFFVIVAVPLTFMIGNLAQ